MKLLLLAGTREAREVADWLHREGIPAIASFAGATRAPELPKIETRVGGFGREDAFTQFVGDAQITHILDATHPFAAAISTRTARFAAREGVPYCQVLRPPWTPEPGDRWTALDREEEVAEHIPEAARVFLATGRQTLKRFHVISDRYLICRQIDPPDMPFPFPNGRYLIGRPPFSVEDEVALFQELKIDWLVVKNAGGASSATKLTAARALGLPVAMIARPAQPPGRKVQSAKEAIAWINAQR